MIDLPALIAQCAPDVAPGTMARIIRHESGAKPYAIGVNSKEVRLKRQPANAAEATAWAEYLIGQGYSIDMGPAQINSANLKRLGLNLQTVFEPCSNIRAASKLLTENYQLAVKQYGEGQQALEAALSMYNTGRFTGEIGRGYVLNLKSVRVESTKVSER